MKSGMSHIHALTTALTCLPLSWPPGKDEVKDEGGRRAT